MNEIAPGIQHWKAIHPKIRMEVSSYYLPDSRTLIDPLFENDDLDPIRSDPRFKKELDLAKKRTR